MAEVKARVTADTTAFKKGLDSAKSIANKWATDVGKMFVGAFAVTKIMSSLSSLTQELDRVGKLATRLGVLPSTIAKIGKAAELAGTDVEQVVKAMAKLTLSASTSAEAFEEAGINAAEFARSDVQAQVLMLSKAYQAAGDDANKVLSIQKLLGSEAQELIPLLKQGPDALAETMGGVSQHYDQMVRKTEAFNDAVTNLKKRAVNHLAEIVHAGRRAAAAFGSIGTSKGFMGGLAEFQERMDREEMAERDSIKRSMIEAALDEESKAAKEAELKADEEIRKLQAEVRGIIQKRNFDALSAEEQILKLTKDQLAVKEKMKDIGKISALELVQLEKEYLDIDAKLADAKSNRDAINEKAKADQESLRMEIEEETRAAIKRVAEEEDRRALAAMDPAERAEELQKRQSAMFQKSEGLAEFGDIKGAAEARIEALYLGDAIAKALADAMPDAIEEANEETARSSVVSSSLAAVGGGGGSFVAGMAPELIELKNQTRLLEQIANNSNIQTTRPERERF
jgi:hypothetical protein